MSSDTYHLQLVTQPVVLLQTGRPYGWTPSVETAVKSPEKPPFDRFKISVIEGVLEKDDKEKANKDDGDFWESTVNDGIVIKQVVIWNESFIFKISDPSLDSVKIMVYAGRWRKSVGETLYSLKNLAHQRDIEESILIRKRSGEKIGVILVRFWAKNFGMDSDDLSKNVPHGVSMKLNLPDGDSSSTSISPRETSEIRHHPKQKQPGWIQWILSNPLFNSENIGKLKAYFHLPPTEAFVERFDCHMTHSGTMYLFDEHLIFLIPSTQTEVVLSFKQIVSIEESKVGFLRSAAITVKTTSSSTYEFSFSGIESTKNRDQAFRIAKYLHDRYQAKLEAGVPKEVYKALGGLKFPDAQAEMRKIFQSELNNPNEHLVNYYLCSWNLFDRLVPGVIGWMYATDRHFCFYYTKMFFTTVRLVLSWEKVLRVVPKMSPSYVIPLGIDILTDDGKTHVFTNFLNRDASFRVIEETWLNYWVDAKLTESPYNASELRLLLHQFIAMDSEGKGLIQYGDLLQGLGLPVSSVLSHSLASAFDFSDRGSIDFKSFAKATLIMTIGTADERLEYSYRMFDNQRRGKVFRGGFSALLTELYPSDWQQLDKSLDEKFSKMDPDSLGYVTLENFKKGVREDKALRNLLKLEFLNDGDEDSSAGESSGDGSSSGRRRSRSQKKSLKGTFGMGNSNLKLLQKMMMGLNCLQMEYKRLEKAIAKSKRQSAQIQAEIDAGQLDTLDYKITSSEWEVVDKQSVLMNEDEVNRKRSLELEKGLDGEIFTLVEFAPEVFAKIRNLFELSNEDYWGSINPGAFASGILAGKWSMPESLSSSGRSGSFIYKTDDNFLVIKSLPSFETKRCLSLLLDYVKHVESSRDTLLTRFYGLYELKSSSGISANFVIMENAILSPKPLHEQYDLKGSTVNRSVPVELRKAGMALKDVDLEQNRRRVLIGDIKKKALVEQLRKDAKFLCDHNGLDYSLLLGIIFEEKEPLSEPSSPNMKKSQSSDSEGAELRTNKSNPNLLALADYPHSYRSQFHQDFGGIKTNLNTETYFYLGLIDILTEWDMSKLSEHVTKTVVLAQDRNEISAVRPSVYYERFVQYLDRIIQ